MPRRWQRRGARSTGNLSSMSFAPRWPSCVIFHDRENVVPGGFARALPTQHLVEMRQPFMAGPDDEQVEAPTFLRGDPLRITEGGSYA